MILTNEQNANCHKIIHGASVSAAGVGGGLAQLPLSDNLVITPMQITMIIAIGSVLNIQLSQSAAVVILSTVVTGQIGRGISQMLIGWIPGVGNAINASTAAALTEAVGWATVKYFEKLSKEEVEKYKSAKEEGHQKAKAEFDIKIKERNENFRKVFETLEEYKCFLIGAFSIGIAAANIKGNVSEEDRKSLELAILGESIRTIPRGFLDKISNLFVDKPTFNDAMKIIEKVDKVHWKAFDNVVDVVLSSDDSNKEEKAAFKIAWNEKYNAA